MAAWSEREASQEYVLPRKCTAPQGIEKVPLSRDGLFGRYPTCRAPRPTRHHRSRPGRVGVKARGLVCWALLRAEVWHREIGQEVHPNEAADAYPESQDEDEQEHGA